MQSVIKQKLVLAKNFYIRARNIEDSNDALDRMVAIHHFHIAIEITLRTLVTKYGISTYKDNSGFADLIGIIGKSTKFKSEGLKIPYEGKIRTVNIRRNDIQHNFIEPSSDAVRRTGLDTYSFLFETYATHFTENFDTLSEAILINSIRLRRCVEYAYKHCSRKNYASTYRCLSVAFELARIYTKKPHDGTEIFNTFHDLSNLSTNDDMPEELIDYLERIGAQTNRNTESLMLHSSGIDFKAYTEFRKHKPYVSFMGNGSVHFGFEPNRDPSEAECISAIEFVIRTILDWQGALADESFDAYEVGLKEYFDSQEEIFSDVP